MGVRLRLQHDNPVYGTLNQATPFSRATRGPLTLQTALRMP